MRVPCCFVETALSQKQAMMRQFIDTGLQAGVFFEPAHFSKASTQALSVALSD